MADGHGSDRGNPIERTAAIEPIRLFKREAKQQGRPNCQCNAQSGKQEEKLKRDWKQAKTEKQNWRHQKGY
ncbi:hypothetical protein [uncultured Cohaesibacter sp.]|uniref:hypothetical protein n=1 Tax=uncultured Cohaesibacter sp. TaxID=1002546 RepID=UPI0029C60A17|nr:hypothetical protein [uncultured Cohaesibacter sp.]